MDMDDEKKSEKKEADNKEYDIDGKEKEVDIASSFMEYEEGKNCCICLSAPHGFRRTARQEQIFSNRKDIKNNANIKTMSDLNTMEILYEISDAIKQLQMDSDSDEKNDVIVPGYVVLKVHRTYLDANRSMESFAYSPQDAAAKSVYELYHECITKEIDRMRMESEHNANDKKQRIRMLLIDIHGQAKKEFANGICIGTKSGKTCDGNGNKDKILASLLKYVIDDLDWVKLVGLKHNDEYGAYSGGYTVQTHSETNNVYAIQLEFGSKIRKQKDKRKAVAKAIAKGILEIHKNGIYKK